MKRLILRPFLSSSSALAVSALLLGGCAVGPDFSLPSLDLGNGWFNSPTDSKATPLADRWWASLNDPVLDQMVDQALASSPNIRSAAARVVAARAQRLQAQADMAPALNASGSASYAKTSQAGSTRADRTSNLFSTGFDASWELDIFGGKRRTAEAARANLAATRADYANARLSLIADVVSTYADYRLAEERIRLTEATIAAQQKTTNLTEARLKAGDISGLDAAQANSLLATTRAALPALRQQKELARGTLAILLGQMPTRFAVSPSAITLTDAALPDVPAGLPSTLLQRRPDIITAQQNLRGANARIGTAEAARFPTFNLTAALGVQSRILGDLLTSGNDFWTLGPSIGLPLFDAGNRKALVKQRKAEYDEYEVAYTQAILNALREVESNLTNVSEERLRVQELKNAATHSQRAATIADALYRAGDQSLLPVLDAQRSLYSAQDGLAQSQTSLVKDWVALVKALGGGYVAPHAE